MEVFILMLIVVGVVVTVAAVKSGGSNANPIWSAAAQRLGLQWYELSDMISSPKIAGTRRGFSVNIDTFAKSGDDNRKYTRYRLYFKEPLGLGLRIAQHGPLTHFSKKLGSQEIETGDKEFDDIMLVKGRDPQAVSQFLTYTRKLRLLRFFTTHSGATIDDSGIQFEERGVARSPDRIVQVVQKMTTLAEQLTGEESGADYLEAMAVPDQVEIRNHEIYMPERTEPWPVSLDEILQTESEPVEPTESRRSLPEVPEAIDADVLSEVEPSDIVEPTPEKSETAEPSFSHDAGLTISTVAETLFAHGLTTSQTEELFENNYKGRSVAWSGTLTNVRSFRFDLVFGDEPGTRAEFDIDPEDIPSTGRPTKAVVQFPLEAEEELRAHVDKRVAFRGALTSCDAFLKTLFLTDAQIVEVDA